MKPVKSIDVKLKIKQIKIKQTGDKTIDELLPSVFNKEYVELELYGIPTPIANGLRRLLIRQTTNYYLHIEKLTTDDPFHLSDFLENRVSLIPLSQKVNPSTKFELKVHNDSASTKVIYTKDIKGKTGLFEPNIEICTLEPQRTLHMDIVIKFGNTKAEHMVANRVACLPLDQKPYDAETNTGIHSSVSDPQDSKITFYTNGNIEAKEHIKKAVELFIKKCQANFTIIKDINHEKVHIPYSDDTLGNALIYKLLQFKEIKFAKYDKKENSTDLIISLINDTDIDTKQLIKIELEKIVETLNTIIRKLNL